MRAYFERFEISMTKKQALSASHAGQCDEDVKALCNDKKIKAQLAKITSDSMIAELKEYGAWDYDELSNREDNEARIVWIAACNIREEHNL